MKNILLVVGVCIMSSQMMIAQKYFTKTAVITFESSTPLEKIEAINKSGTCVVDFATGNVEFAVLVKGFQFDKALMQEHFNENYMESTKFPKANFKGKIENAHQVNLSKNGKHKVRVSGQLTIHGVTQPHSSDVLLEVKDGKVFSSAAINITLADFGISIPSLVRDNISKVVSVKLAGTLDPLK